MASPMTSSQLIGALKKWKVNYKLYPGYTTRKRPGSFTPIGFIVHHTGGAFTESDSYLKFLFETGRPSEGIPGPLCQFSGGPSGKIYVGSLGRSNHAGRGDWTTRQLVGGESYSGYSREIKPGSDDYGTGNALYYGLEINYPGTVPMKNAQYNSAVRLAAAIMDFYGWTALSTIAHREHSSRKWDPGRAPLDKFRRDVRDLLRAGPGGEIMSYDEVWRTDGKMVGPNKQDTSAPAKYWWAESVMEWLGRALAKPIDTKGGTNETISPRGAWQWAYIHSRRSSTSIQDKVIPLLQEIKAAQGGTARDEVLAEIQADLATTKNLMSTMADDLDNLKELAENFADGSLNATEVANQLLAMFHAATAPEEEEV